MKLLDGKYVSTKFKGEIALEAAKIVESTGRKLRLVAKLVEIITKLNIICDIYVR